MGGNGTQLIVISSNRAAAAATAESTLLLIDNFIEVENARARFCSPDEVGTSWGDTVD
jgi:hypothetical protein